jgi:type I restriction enzyme S subunit
MKTTNKNIPLLRFPEFKGDWEKKTLEEIADRVNTRNNSNEVKNVFTNSAVQGIVNQRDFFDKDIANQNNLLNYYVVEKDDFIYNPRISNQAPVGPISRNHIGQGVMSPLYSVFKFKVGNLDFIETYFSTTLWYEYLESIANYGARFDRMNITVKDFYEMPLPFPTLPEQTRIASFFSAIDQKLIQLKQKKSLLEQYKKGVMQRLFLSELGLSGLEDDRINNAEENPTINKSYKSKFRQLRFKDENGKEFPKWEKKKLGEVAKFLDEKRVPISEIERQTKKGNYPYYGASGIIDYVDDYLFDGEYILLGEDGANILNRTTELAFIVTGRFWVNNHAHVMQAIGNNRFLAESLERINYEPYNTGTVQPKLNAAICKSIPIEIPCIEEQNKIANFLSTIDEKINQCQTQIEKTELWKKGLLQKMFV